MFLALSGNQSVNAVLCGRMGLSTQDHFFSRRQIAFSALRRRGYKDAERVH